jgi:thymidylate synthase (FAD)
LTAQKLLRYLAKHKHWSPFEMVNVVMEITTTRDIARQILRHRSFSFQEFSQRYADPTQDLGFVTREARLQDQKNRQNSIEIDNKELQEDWEIQQNKITKLVRDTYEWAVANGIAKEQARSVLPEGLTVSRMYMNGTLRSWVHYCQLRMGPETQKEHREVARDAWYQITEVFPSLKDCLDLGEK